MTRKINARSLTQMLALATLYTFVSIDVNTEYRVVRYKAESRTYRTNGVTECTPVFKCNRADYSH
jgi:hypothetical protein